MGRLAVTAARNRSLLRARDVIDRGYAERLTVGALARAVNLSPGHFSRQFQATFGESPHQYLIARRLERAASMLWTTDATVADICGRVGLRSVGSFTTAFGRAFGLSPNAYRASRRGDAYPAAVPLCAMRGWMGPPAPASRGG